MLFALINEFFWHTLNGLSLTQAVVGAEQPSWGILATVHTLWWIFKAQCLGLQIDNAPCG